jgi:cbb3-type cytochrome oxidase subunit 3
MIINLLVITFLLSLILACLVAWVFRKPISKIMTRIIGDPLSFAWVRFMMAAIVVVGVGGGVRPWDYEKYITPVKDQPVIVLNSDRWVLEIYRTVIGTAQSITWMLLVFFVFAVIAYVLLRGAELRQTKPL